MLATSGQSVRGSDRRACVAASQSMVPAAPEASQDRESFRRLGNGVRMGDAADIEAKCPRVLAQQHLKVRP